MNKADRTTITISFGTHYPVEFHIHDLSQDAVVRSIKESILRYYRQCLKCADYVGQNAIGVKRGNDVWCRDCAPKAPKEIGKCDLCDSSLYEATDYKTMCNPDGSVVALVCSDCSKKLSRLLKE